MNRSLIADDDAISRSMLQTILKTEKWDIHLAENGQAAIDALSECHYSCLLLDLHMPVKDGFAVLQYMKDADRLGQIPVIVITSEESAEIRDRAFAQGASDVIQKPFDKNLVIRRVRIAVMISQQTEQLNQFRQQINYDYMTGLLNKRAFFSTVELAMKEYKTGAMLLMDIDGLKSVNDTMGHTVGDRLIADFASILNNYFTGNAILSHLSGDEFAVYVPSMDKPQQALLESKQLLEKIRKELVRPEASRMLSASIGISLYPSQARDLTALYNFADYAMLYVKNNGRNGYHLYEIRDNLQEELRGREECTYSRADRLLSGRRGEEKQLWVKYGHFRLIWGCLRTQTSVQAAAVLFTFRGTDGVAQLPKKTLHPVTEQLTDYIHLRGFAGVFCWYSFNEFLLLTYQPEELRMLLEDIQEELAPLLKKTGLQVETAIEYLNGAEEVLWKAPLQNVEADPIITSILGYFVDAMVDIDLDNLHYKAYRYLPGKKLRVNSGDDFNDEVNRYLQQDVHPDDRAGVFALENVDALRTCFRSGRNRMTERYRVNRDGRWVPVETLIFFEYAGGHRHTYLIDRNVAETAADIEKEEQFKAREQEFTRLRANQAASEELMDTLATVVEYRNLESGEHIKRIKEYTKVLAEELMRSYPDYGLTTRAIDHIVAASVLHDIGKIAIPDDILLKTGPLTADEFEIMKKHSVRGSEIIRRIPDLQDAEYTAYCYDIARYHHERYDGKGYPDGLVGDEIPISAQIVSLADVYDALVNRRINREVCSLSEACQMIADGRCGAFNPRLLRCFAACYDTFEEMALRGNKISPAEKIRRQQAMNLEQRRILVVDDAAISRETLCRTVEELGATAVPADSGVAALRAVSASREGYFDMILLDINMPDMDGYITARRLRLLPRHDSKKVPIIAVSSNLTEESQEKSRDSGMNRFLRKPIKPETLLACMEEYLVG
ncbi:MAG: response regulator [Clostridiales bacterium]|nr:response regulator [Clostridiales bacterium]